MSFFDTFTTTQASGTTIAYAGTWGPPSTRNLNLIAGGTTSIGPATFNITTSIVSVTNVNITYTPSSPQDFSELVSVTLQGITTSNFNQPVTVTLLLNTVPVGSVSVPNGLVSQDVVLNVTTPFTDPVTSIILAFSNPANPIVATFVMDGFTSFFVCVAHGSKIKTLQGEKYIQDLQRGDEIIGGKIARVIREELHPQSLVQAIFGYKDCLEENVPNQDTWLCAEHYIIYKGKRRMAKCFSAYPGVVYYENCPVYKILPMVKDKKYYFYDIQYEEEGEYVVNNLLSQSRSPFAIVSPLAKELYFNPEKYKDIKVKNALTENPPISFDYILPDGREVKSLVLLKERN